MGMSQTPANVASRALYLYVNKSASIRGGAKPDQQDVASRSLYAYVNKAKHGLAGQRVLNQNDILSRSLYIYLNIAHDRDPTNVIARALYLYDEKIDGELFPWIMKIEPTEALEGQQVRIYGDGFGATQAAEASTVRLGVYDPTVVGPGGSMGIVSWSSRSPGLYPANGGGSITAAIVVVVPDEADSGYVSVEETT